MEKSGEERLCKRQLRRLAAAALLMLVPLFLIGLYARPSADDFVYGMRAHAAIQQGGGFFAALKAAWETDVYYFNNWQGLYISGFTLALVPSVFGEKLYALTPVLVLGILYLCLWGMLHFLLKNLLPQKRRCAPAAALLLLFAYAQGMPNQVEGLYWYNGAMNYLPYFALCLLNIGLMTEVYALPAGAHAGRAALLLGACAASVVISGGHQVAALLNLLLLLGAVAVFARGRRFWPVLPFAAGLCGLLINLTSPGTAVRQAGFSGASFPEAAVKSLILAALALFRWLDVPLLCLAALATPLLLCFVRGKVGAGLDYTRWWLPWAATFVLMWAMIFLPSYTMGGIGPGRLINVVWLTFVPGALAGYGGLLGWLIHKKGVALPEPGPWLYGKKAAAAGMALLAVMACIGGHTVKEGLDNHFATTLEALYELGEGTPQAFAAALDARTAALADPAADAVEVVPLTEEQRPYLLFFNDVSAAGDVSWLGSYYDKTVTVAGE